VAPFGAPKWQANLLRMIRPIRTDGPDDLTTQECLVHSLRTAN
jgi:hypothetical protein